MESKGSQSKKSWTKIKLEDFNDFKTYYKATVKKKNCGFNIKERHTGPRI